MTRATLALVFLVACGNAPSEADCAALLDHVIALELAAAGAAATTPEARAELDVQRQKVAAQIGPEFLAACRDDLPRDQVSCGRAARSLEELAACDGS